MKRLRNIFSFIKTFDFQLISLALALCCIGMVVIYSATQSYENSFRYILVQGGALIVGLVFIYYVVKMDYEYISSFWPYIYAFNVIMLILVIVIGVGSEETGTTGWIRFGPIGIQPSELVKVGFIITLACYLDKVKRDINYVKTVAKLLLHLAIPVGLILLQPDFGTAMVFIFIFFVMLFVAGIDWRYILGAFLSIGILSPLIYFFILSDYQKNRILNFFTPEHDPSGSGYQVMQSKIAIGSGQIFGKGLFHGTQTQLGYLPEKHTDFIFAVVGEELGLIGCLVVLLLLILLIARCIYIASRARNELGGLLCSGVAALFLFHTLENIGMTLGLMPVTGIPLPFVSYGGSSLATYLIALGLVISVSIRRKPINF